MSAIKQDNRLIGYLLGKLSPQERQQIEDRYIEDEDFFTELQVAEDEIIDAYVNDQLSARDRELFEQHFLNSQRRRERVRSARALLAFADKHKQPATQDRISLLQRAHAFLRLDYPILQWGLVAGMVVTLVAGGWLYARLRSNLADARTEQAKQRERDQEMNQSLQDKKEKIEELSRELSAEAKEKERLEQEIEQSKREIARLKKQASANDQVTEALGYGQTEIGRGGTNPDNQKTILLPASAETVRLQLDLQQDEYPRYLVALETAEGKEIWHGSFSSTKTSNGKAVIVRLRAKDLANGDYRLILNGVTEQNEEKNISEFPIRILRK